MKDTTRKGRSGRLFFLVVFALICLGILATVLLANGQRDLKLLLRHLGYPDLLADAAPPPVKVAIRQRRGIRLPPSRIVLPAHAFTDLRTPGQHFVRLIQSDPKTLCDEMRERGFGNLDWAVSPASAQVWECSSNVVLSPASAEDGAAQSSIFIFIRGDAERRVTSFRVKLNIENPDDAKKVTDLAGKAAIAFLTEVRWGDPGDVVGKISRLEAFDMQNYGSRVQFKREGGDVSRYNFLATQIVKPRRYEPGDLFFDRSKWLPLADHAVPSLIEGMMAGESIEAAPADRR